MKLRCQMITILLTLMAVLPWTAAVVNCWKACKNCRDNTNHPEILDVYCSMCQECRKRRSWMRNGGAENAPMEVNDGYQQNEFQAGCPTPPFCDSSGEQSYTQMTTMPYTIPTPAPIMTSSTCPPYPACIKRKRPTTQLMTHTYPPQQYTPQQYTPQQYTPQQYTPRQYPPQQYNPPQQYYPPQQDPPPSPQPLPPSTQQNTAQYPPCNPCMPLCPMPCSWPGGPPMPGSDTKSNGQSNQEAPDFTYVYVGVPKELVKEIG